MLESETAGAPPRRWLKRATGLGEKRLFLPFLVSLAYVLLIAYAGRTHTFGTYSTETDFYHFYAPDAARLTAGQFPENTYQGPGYPLVLAAFTAVTGDVFLSGKWLSMLGAAGVGVLAFALFVRLFGSTVVGLGAQLLTFAAPQFSEFAISATTDIFFLLICLAAFVVFVGLKRAPRGGREVSLRAAAAALLAGIAYLTRYNGLFLTVTFAAGLTVLDVWRVNWRERVRAVAIFAVVFAVVVAPWLYANRRHHGSPFYNTNYLNIATEYYPELAAGSVFQEGTRRMAQSYESFGDVLAYDPARLIKQYPRKVFENLRQSLTGDLVGPWVGWLALLGLALALLRRRTREVWLLLGATTLHFLVLSLTHWEARYYFFVMVVYAGFAAYAPFALLELMRERGERWRDPKFALVPAAIVLALFAWSLRPARKQFDKFVAGQPKDVLPVCDYFRGAGITGTRLVARKPHAAFICEQEWVYFPSAKSIDELRDWLRDNPAEYLTISRMEISRRKEMGQLKNPDHAPTWLRAVLNDQSLPLVIYRIERDKLITP